MGGNKSRRHKQSKRSQQPTAAVTGNWYRRLALGWKILIFAVGVPGLYIGIVGALPKVSVTAGQTFGAHHPLAFPLVISNDGNLAVHSVELRCIVNEFLTSDNVLISNSESTNLSSIHIGDLAAGGTTTEFCGDIPVGGPTNPPRYKRARVIVNLSFRPDFLPWRKVRSFTFRGAVSEDGQLHWLKTSN
jgi:hypothetical protein